DGRRTATSSGSAEPDDMGDRVAARHPVRKLGGLRPANASPVRFFEEARRYARRAPVAEVDDFDGGGQSPGPGPGAAPGERALVTRSVAPPSLSEWQLEMYVGAEADGVATADQLEVLEEHKNAWRATLARLLRDAEEHLATARNIRGEERAQIVADL